MLLFWEHGYEGTSYEALIQALEISASSFQNAFGSKEALYEEAVKRYLSSNIAEFNRLLELPVSTRAAFEQLLMASASAYTAGNCPSGCMISIAAIQTSPAMTPIKEFAAKIRRELEGALAERIRRGMRAGDVPPDADPDALAVYFGTVFRGMAVQARDGCAREALEDIVHRAMCAWPA